MPSFTHSHHHHNNNNNNSNPNTLTRVRTRSTSIVAHLSRNGHHLIEGDLRPPIERKPMQTDLQLVVKGTTSATKKTNQVQTRPLRSSLIPHLVKCCSMMRWLRYLRRFHFRCLHSRHPSRL